MLVSTSLPTFGFPAETPPEPGGIRERAALESSNGVITLCLTVPLTHKPGCEDSFSSPSVYASVQGVRGVPFSLVEKGQDLLPKVCRNFRAQMTLTTVSCLCRAFS